MKFIPNVNIFYMGRFCPAGAAVEIDSGDAAELKEYGQIKEPANEPVREEKEPAEEQPVKKRGRKKASEVTEHDA